MKLPKIYLSKRNWTSDCYRPSFTKAWSGKIWYISAYKYVLTIDFRGGFKLTDLLTEKEKKEYEKGKHP